MNRLLELQQQLADSAARSDIEAYCKPAERSEIGTWYFDRSHEREYSAFVEKAIEYLTLRNRIARHPDHVDWIRVNFDAEAVKEYTLSAVRENFPSGWQPMETAPKDGTAFLMCSGRWRLTCHWHIHRHCWASCGPTYERLPFDEQPEYWMPLPEVPQSEEGE